MFLLMRLGPFLRELCCVAYRLANSFRDCRASCQSNRKRALGRKLAAPGVEVALVFQRRLQA